MGVLFTSDLHLGHAKVAAKRGFMSSAEHDLEVSRRWASVVRPDDDVYVLGDATGNASRVSLDWAFQVLAALPGRKHLVWGNHDGGHPMHRDAHKFVRRYLEVFESVNSAARRRIYGREVLLSHFPYERDRDEVRHTQWRLRDEGLPLLHGHTHGDERLTVTDSWTGTRGPRRARIANRVEVHVGLDAWDLTPVPLDVVHGLLEESRLF